MRQPRRLLADISLHFQALSVSEPVQHGGLTHSLASRILPHHRRRRLTVSSIDRRLQRRAVPAGGCYTAAAGSSDLWTDDDGGGAGGNLFIDTPPRHCDLTRAERLSSCRTFHVLFCIV